MLTNEHVASMSGCNRMLFCLPEVNTAHKSLMKNVSFGFLHRSGSSRQAFGMLFASCNLFQSYRRSKNATSLPARNWCGSRRLGLAFPSLLSDLYMEKNVNFSEGLISTPLKGNLAVRTLRSVRFEDWFSSSWNEGRIGLIHATTFEHSIAGANCCCILCMHHGRGFSGSLYWCNGATRCIITSCSFHT